MTSTPDPRSRIRAWWKEQLATGEPIDLDAAAEEATAVLIADPAFVAALADAIVRPLVRDIGQRTVQQRSGGTRAPRVQVGRTVMSREQAIRLVDSSLSTQAPHWSKLVVRQGEPAWFMALSRDELLAEAQRLKREGKERLKEAAFLASVGSTLDVDQVVSDRWSERGLEELFGSIDVQFNVGIDPKRAQGAAQLSGSKPAPPSVDSNEPKEHAA